MGENRKLEARVRAKGLWEFFGTSAIVHTTQLQRAISVLTIISYRRWNFRVMDVARAFLKSAHLGIVIYAKTPYFSECKDVETREVSKPLYGLRTYSL